MRALRAAVVVQVALEPAVVAGMDIAPVAGKLSLNQQLAKLEAQHMSQVVASLVVPIQQAAEKLVLLVVRTPKVVEQPVVPPLGLQHTSLGLELQWWWKVQHTWLGQNM